MNDTRDKLMERTRAARCLVDQAYGGNEDMEMSAFLSIFHPEMRPEKSQQLIADARQRKNRRKDR